MPVWMDTGDGGGGGGPSGVTLKVCAQRLQAQKMEGAWVPGAADGKQLLREGGFLCDGNKHTR